MTDNLTSEEGQASLDNPVISIISSNQTTENRRNKRGKKLTEDSLIIPGATLLYQEPLKAKNARTDDQRKPSRRRSKAKNQRKLYEIDDPQDDPVLSEKIHKAKRAKKQRDRMKERKDTLVAEFNSIDNERSRLDSEKQQLKKSIAELERTLLERKVMDYRIDEEEAGVQEAEEQLMKRIAKLERTLQERNVMDYRIDEEEAGVQDAVSTEPQIQMDVHQPQDDLVQDDQQGQQQIELKIYPGYKASLDWSGNLLITDSIGAPVAKIPTTLLPLNPNRNQQENQIQLDTPVVNGSNEGNGNVIFHLKDF